jgi:tRNA threonylcarbamoyladenosine biosynthesis protein TsaE
VDGEDFSLVSHSLVETQELGSVLGQLMDDQEVVCLEGELGTGKTSLIQAIGRARDVMSPITSPTFTLVNEYRARGGSLLYHVDLYRLGRPEEIVQAGIDAYFHGDGICLIEWAEKAGALLPSEHLYITLEHAGGDTRRISLRARGDYHRALLHRLRTAIRLDT